MTLVWHDWFATSRAVVDTRWMLRQNELLRRHALGDFAGLVREITRDPAMLTWLNGISNTRAEPNENYARELQELFCLGAGNGYSERDVRELARALTGWRADWREGVGWTHFRLDRSRQDRGRKRIHGHRGRYDWADAAALAVRHPRHPRFFVAKLWGYFIPVPPPPRTRAGLERLYRRSGHDVRPVVAAILRHPLLYEGPRMVKPPVVYTAGLLRALGRGIDTDAWSWLTPMTGQTLFEPPNVAGWDDDRWLDTGTWRARWMVANYALEGHTLDPKGKHPASTASGPSGPCGRARLLGPAGASAPRRARELIAFAAARRRVRRRAVEAHDLRDPAPERTAHAARHVAGHADELMAHHCRDFSRTEALRARRRARGCPVVEPGMPAPAGSGLSRRSLLLRSAGLALAVYGAGRLSPRRRGGARRAAAGGAGARPGLPRRRHGLGLVPRPDGGRRLSAPAAAARAGAGQRRGLRRGRRACAGIRRRRRSPRCTARARSRSCRPSATSTPTSRTSSRATSMRSARSTRGWRPAGSGATSTASARPTTRSRGSRSTRAWRPRWRRRACPSPPSTSPAEYDFWARDVWGDVQDLMLDASARIGAAHAGAASAPCARRRARRCSPARLRAQLAPFRPADDAPAFTSPVAYPASRVGLPERLAALAAMLAAGLPLRCVAITAPGDYDTHADQASRPRRAAEAGVRHARGVPARPRGARPGRPRARPRVVGVRPPRGGERSTAPTTAPPASGCWSAPAPPGA